MQDNSITCSSTKEIIRIDRVFTTFVANATTCDETFQGGSIAGNPALRCRAWQKEVYVRYRIFIIQLQTKIL